MSNFDKLKNARELYAFSRIDDALNEISNVPLEYEWSADDLLLKARLIQLADRTNIPLHQVEQCLKQALLLSPSNAEIKIELGWFYLNVMDDANAAFPYFREAVEKANSQLAESLQGVAECEKEIGQ